MYRETAKAIQSLRIQGAHAIAFEGAKALALCKTRAELRKAVAVLSNARPTEPCLRNSLKFCSASLPRDFSGELSSRIKQVGKYFNEAHKKIALYGSRRIKRGSIVFTHCHSSSVVAVLIKARHKRFAVHNTETRPFFQGRLTARELAKAGIKVTHFVDAAARLALKKADLMLIGADAITSDGFVVNKIGSELFAEVAAGYQIPIYACTFSWKYDSHTMLGFEEELESRYAKEVWPNPPKHINVSNVVFEKVHPRLITGIVSELGVHTVEGFVEEVKRAYPWI
jgi:ribose 1,5-bisphosphate isomerase